MEELSRIGESLVRERRARGISQRVLGQVVGVSQQQIARWERSAYRSASLTRVGEIGAVLGFEARLEVRPAPRVVAAVEEAETSKRVRDLAEVLSRIREHGPVLAERFGVKLVDVFGAFARGEQTENSFVALVVELEQPTISSVMGSDMYLQEILGRSVQAGPLSSIPPEEQQRIASERVRAWPVV